MSLAANFIQSVQVLRQSAEEGRFAKSAQSFPPYPTLENVLVQFRPLPENGLFLGVASDGLPVFLNLKDPRPGPLLIMGDAQTGKTDLLQGVARAASLVYSPRVLRFAVITPYPHEWEGWGSLPHCLGIWKPNALELVGILSEIRKRAQTEGRKESLLLLVDDLAGMAESDSVVTQNWREILTNGTQAGIWTFATLNADLAFSCSLWTRLFGTCIFSRVQNRSLADRLTSMPGANLGTLFSGNQFCIRERNHWLRFWLPLLK